LKRLAGWGDHNEFAMCMFALGGAVDAACSADQDVRSGADEGRQRQPVGLAVLAVSARLVRDQLIPWKSATPRKRNIIAWRRPFRYWALKSPTPICLWRQPKVRCNLENSAPTGLPNPLKNRAEVARRRE
jgi:hypothetical protein